MAEKKACCFRAATLAAISAQRWPGTRSRSPDTETRLNGARLNRLRAQVATNSIFRPIGQRRLHDNVKLCDPLQRSDALVRCNRSGKLSRFLLTLTRTTGDGGGRTAAAFRGGLTTCRGRCGRKRTIAVRYGAPSRSTAGNRRQKQERGRTPRVTAAMEHSTPLDCAAINTTSSLSCGQETCLVRSVITALAVVGRGWPRDRHRPSAECGRASSRVGPERDGSPVRD
jgi:hypothetical protein